MKDMKHSWHRVIQTDRIESLADGIFAFSMTLLIVNIDIPQMSAQRAMTDLGPALQNLLPILSDFVLSFILLAIFWDIHQRQFEGIEYIDRRLSWINIFLLLFVVFIPFSTELIATYDKSTLAVAVFNANLLSIGVLLFLTWYYAQKNNLTDPKLTKEELYHFKIKNFIIIPVATAALVLGFFTPAWCTLIYLIIPIIVFLLEKGEKESVENMATKA